MEHHIERLIAACGLAQFSYRPWPAPNVITAPRPAAKPVVTFEAMAPEPPVTSLAAETHHIVVPAAVPDIPSSAASPVAGLVARRRIAGVGPIVLPSPESFDQRAGVRRNSQRPLASAGPNVAAGIARPGPAASPRSFALLVEMTAPNPRPGIPRDRRAPIMAPRT